MREQKNLTPSATSVIFTLPWSATSCLVSNPTGSNILFRQGGNDIPTADSATLILPAFSIVQFPVIGGNFAFGFQDVTLVGSQIAPLKVCTIQILDAREPIAAIGSTAVQSTAPLSVTPLIGDVTIPANSWTTLVTVPAGHTLIGFMLSTAAAAGAMLVTASIDVPGSPGINQIWRGTIAQNSSTPWIMTGDPARGLPIPAGQNRQFNVFSPSSAEVIATVWYV